MHVKRANQGLLLSSCPASARPSCPELRSRPPTAWAPPGARRCQALPRSCACVCIRPPRAPRQPAAQPPQALSGLAAAASKPKVAALNTPKVAPLNTPFYPNCTPASVAQRNRTPALPSPPTPAHHSLQLLLLLLLLPAAYGWHTPRYSVSPLLLPLLPRAAAAAAPHSQAAPTQPAQRHTVTTSCTPPPPPLLTHCRPRLLTRRYPTRPYDRTTSSCTRDARQMASSLSRSGSRIWGVGPGGQGVGARVADGGREVQGLGWLEKANRRQCVGRAEAAQVAQHKCDSAVRDQTMWRKCE